MTKQRYLKLLETVATVISIVGVGLLAINHSDFSKHGWWICMISNGLWLHFALKIEKKGLAFTNGVFLLTSLIGIYRGFW